MFNTDFFDGYTRHLFSTWWLYLVFGINLILLSILIIIVPAMLAYLVAGFLLTDGIILLTVAFRYKRKYQKKEQENVITVD